MAPTDPDALARTLIRPFTADSDDSDLVASALVDGDVANVDPWAALFNPGVWTQFAHMWTATFIVVGFTPAMPSNSGAMACPRLSCTGRPRRSGMVRCGSTPSRW